MSHCHPTLLELQKAFCQSLLRADAGAAALVLADGFDVEERLDIYRNTVATVLVRALRLSYPAIRYLVGAEFFDGAARLFVDASPPKTACLDEYGEGFPAFLEQLSQAASLVYLPDVARLEWLVNTLLHAPDPGPLELSRLATLDEATLGRMSFEPHPAVQLFRSDFPVDSIWRSVLERDDAAMAAIDLTQGPVWLLVSRSRAGMELARLSESQWHLTAAVFAGHPLQQALADVRCTEPHVLLARHLARGCFINAQASD